jgi:microcystin-dependent protein
MSFYPNQLQSFSLAGAGVVAGATSVTLKSMKDIDGNALTMAGSFGTIGYATLEPGSNSLEEEISFSTLVNNSNGTTTLGGVNSITFGQPYSSTSGFVKSHSGSTSLVISNTSGYYTEFGIKKNNETITGFWNVPDPVSPTNIANREWVLSVVNGGPVSQSALVVTGTAGATLVAGNYVYLKASDGKWYLTDATDSTKTDSVQIGIAQGASTAGNAITGGVLLKGIDINQSGITAGTPYYLSNTPGTAGTSPGTFSRIVGQGNSATGIYFDPFYANAVTSNQEGALAGSLGTPSATNRYVTQSDTTLLTPPGSIVSFTGRTSPTGWLLCNGSAVSRSTYSSLFATIAPAQAFTVTLATPAVFTKASHGLVIGDKISLTTTGLLPTGLSTNTDYYVISSGLTSSNFEVSATWGGSAVNTSGSQSGIHTFYISNYGKGDGSTTFNVPDMRGYTPYGYLSSDANFNVLNVPNTYVGEKTHQLITAELASHTHAVTTGAAGGGGNGQAVYSTSSGFSATTSSAGSDAPHNNMPPYVVVNWLIKT